MVGDPDWITEAIADNTLMAFTDGSYIKEINPNLCSVVYILECNLGRDRIVGSFPKQSLVACAYRGELLGLLAIHLILLSVNKVYVELKGKAIINLDCLGALGRVRDLPPYRIPTRCRHSDILKTILVNYGDLSFERVQTCCDASGWLKGVQQVGKTRKIILCMQCWSKNKYLQSNSR